MNEETGSAYLAFPGKRCVVDGGCFVDISMTIMPNPKYPREKVTTIAYSMAFVVGEDRDADWVVRYEYQKDWHTEFEIPARSHIHINAQNETFESFATSRGEGYSVDRLHFPTFRISVEQFIAWIIDDLSVPTRCSKRKALEKLAESHRTFAIEKRTHFG